MKTRRLGILVRTFVVLSASFLSLGVQSAETDDWLPGLQKAHRVVFLGDSITYAGQYIEFIDAYWVTRFPDRRAEFLNLGLPSETVSGLSEEGHAGGQFPRPELRERLVRVLKETKPNLVIACYGMNDGIYLPFSEERFQKFKDGIVELRERVTAAGMNIIHVTPPTFDEVKGGHPGYGNTLDRYSDWLIAQRANGWDVVDLHGPMNRYLAERRQRDPEFFFAADGVHCGDVGHWIIAKQILMHLGAKDVANADDAQDMLMVNPRGKDVLKLVQEEQRMIKDAWLTDTGHKRPGMKKGLPLAEVWAKTAGLDKQIHELAATKQIHEPVATKQIEPAATKQIEPVATKQIEPVATKQIEPVATKQIEPVATKQIEPVATKQIEPAATKQIEPAATGSASGAAPFPGRKSEWQGFDRYDFKLEGKSAIIVVPKQAMPGRPWAWRGEFFGVFANADAALVAKGFHLAYLGVPDLFGSPEAVGLWNGFYKELTTKYGFANKVALIGLSRGGLYCYNWAAANPEKVACIYADAPVCDFKSWPGGKIKDLGNGEGSASEWSKLLKAHGFNSDAEAIAYRGNPVDNLKPLADAHVPLLHVYGDSDTAVPWEENTAVVAERYQQLGGSITLIPKLGVGHHPHGLIDPAPIVDFIMRHSAAKEGK